MTWSSRSPLPLAFFALFALFATCVAVASIANAHAAGEQQAVGSTDPLIAALTDPAGPAEVIVPPGTHRGTFVIKRPMILRGEPGAVLEGDGSGTVLRIEADDVIVGSLEIRHSGHHSTADDAGIHARGNRIRIEDARVSDTLFGIVLNECHSCTIDRAHVTGSGDDAEVRGDGIKLWESDDSIVRGCTVEQSRDVVVWYSRRVTVENNIVRASRYGAHFMNARDSVVRGNRFDRNTVGVFIMYSLRLTVEGNSMVGAHGAAGMGIGFKDSDSIVARGNWFVGNTTGTYLDNTPRTPDAPVTFTGNVFALNDVAMRLHTREPGLALRANAFRDNSTLVEVDGGGSAMSVLVEGNYFSDYAGYDLNKDGVGDVAYEVKTLSSELTTSHPTLQFFHGSAALGIIDAVAHAVPVLAAKRLLTDPAPLVSLPEIASP